MAELTHAHTPHRRVRPPAQPPPPTPPDGPSLPRYTSLLGVSARPYKFSLTGPAFYTTYGRRVGFSGVWVPARPRRRRTYIIASSRASLWTSW